MNYYCSLKYLNKRT